MVRKIALVAIIVVGFVMRLTSLTTYPVHLSLDEVSIGQAAYGIAQTGEDEWGNSWPLAFFSMGDYKPPVTIYLVSMSVKMLGLSELSVRAPVALLGGLSVYFAYLFIKQLGFGARSAILSSLWLAVLPWHVHYSRATFGSVTGMFFLLVALYTFFKWLDLRKQSVALISSASFGVAVWSYHSLRVFVPLLVLGLVYIYRDILFSKHKKQFLNFSLVGVIFALPFLYLSLFTPAIRERAASTSILRESSLSDVLNRGEYGSFTEQVFNNDAYLIFRHWAGKYINYFDTSFWFQEGMQFTPPGYMDMGLMHWIDLPIILLGVILLFKSKNKQLRSLALILALLGPLAASMAMNEQHALRSMPWIIFFLITVASGFENIFKNVKLVKYLFIYFPILLGSVVYFRSIYTNAFPYFNSESWQYGYEQASVYACENIDRYEKIFISETFGSKDIFTSIPNYYLAHYCGGKPTDYLSDDPLAAEKGIYIKRPLWDVDKLRYENTLFIAAPFDFPNNLEEKSIVDKIVYPDAKDAFYIVVTNEE